LSENLIFLFEVLTLSSSKKKTGFISDNPRFTRTTSENKRKNLKIRRFYLLIKFYAILKKKK